MWGTFCRHSAGTTPKSCRSRYLDVIWIIPPITCCTWMHSDILVQSSSPTAHRPLSTTARHRGSSVGLLDVSQFPMQCDPDRHTSLCGFLTVSSTDKIKQAASIAELRAFVLTSAGSQTKRFMLS